MAYGKNTNVDAGDSERQIKTMLRKAGADGTAFFEEPTRIVVVFQLEGRRITFRVPLPDRWSEEFTHARYGARGVQPRTEEAAEKVWEQACRGRWRQLHLCIKAKLESVEAGIESFEDAFLAHVTMPDGQTVGDMVRAPIAIAYQSGTMQPLLPAPKPN